MNIAVLCFGALLATAVAWMYLNVQKPKAYESEDVEDAAKDEVDVSSNDVEAETKISVFAKPTSHRFLFLLLMAISLCGVSVALECIFSSNTLVENGKLIALLSILFVAANIDSRYRIIPNALVLSGLVVRIVFWILELITVPASFWDIMKSDLLACLLVIVFLVVSVLIVKGGIGMGDVKLMLVMCLFQGFYGVISSLFCSLFAAFVYAIVVLLAKKKSKKDSIAFAPAILMGTIISVFLTGM